MLQWYYQAWMKCFFPWQFACKQFITGGNFVFQNEYMYILYTRSYYCKELLLERPSWKTCLQVAVNLSYSSSEFLRLTCEGHIFGGGSVAYCRMHIIVKYIVVATLIFLLNWLHFSTGAALSLPLLLLVLLLLALFLLLHMQIVSMLL